MPCYEPEPEWSRKQIHFFIAALCFAVKHMQDEDISQFPGLYEWKKRHDVIDSVEDESKKWSIKSDYDRETGFGGWSGPKFMHEFLQAEKLGLIP